MSAAMPLTRTPGVSIWLQIEKALADDILGGHVTGRLANELELAGRFGVNRHTVRQAVKALAERGLVEVLHGRGTFVREEAIDYALGRRSRFAHSLAKARRVGASRLTHDAERVPEPEVLALLELPAGSRVVQVVDDKVVGVCTQYFPLPRFAGIAQVYRELGKTHLALARLGVETFERRLGRVTAKLPERAVARQLKQPTATPILYVESVYVDAAGRPIEYGISRFNSAMVQVLVEP
jgi:GntR family transcriptional regulator, phosphonate transport system regulatory protein